jgi:hypothetical protein
MKPIARPINATKITTGSKFGLLAPLLEMLKFRGVAYNRTSYWQPPCVLLPFVLFKWWLGKIGTIPFNRGNPRFSLKLASSAKAVWKCEMSEWVSLSY